MAYAIDYCQAHGTNVSTDEVYDSWCKDVEEAAGKYANNIEPVTEHDTENACLYYTFTEEQICDAFKAGAQWQKEQTIANIRKAVKDKPLQFQMENVEA